MKRLLCILSIITLVSCKKNTDELLQDNTAVSEGTVANGFEPVPAYQWYGMFLPSGNPVNDPDMRNLTVMVNGDVYCAMGEGIIRSYKFNTNTKQWDLYNNNDIFFVNFFLGRQYLFSYQNKIYSGLTRTKDGIMNSFSSHDMGTNANVTLSAFPGTVVNNPTCFVIGNKGYLMGGLSENGLPVNQLWEYNFSINLWTNKGNSPLAARVGATAFVVDTKAYVGMGYDIITLNNTPVKLYKNDWVLFDPNSVYSAIKPDFPGEKRTYTKGFILNGNPYVGFGYDGNGYFTDLWKYNVSTNAWIQQDSWPGTTHNNYGNNIGIFSVGNTGYLVKGGLNQFWRFSNSVIY